MKVSTVGLLLAVSAGLAGYVLLTSPNTNGKSGTARRTVSQQMREPGPESRRLARGRGRKPQVDAGCTEEVSIAFLRQDLRWETMPGEPEFADFKMWADEFARQGRGGRTAEEGVRLARERRAALVDMISKNPRRALELAVPEIVRRTLPAAVRAELEERVDGRGDLLVAAAVAMPGQEAAVPPVQRTVTMEGRTLEAFTYGRRDGAVSRAGLAIHGIALEGKLALSEWPARVLEPVEVAEERTKMSSPPVCPVSGAALDGNGDEVVLDFSLEQAHWFCQAGHAMQELEAAAAQEAALPPGAAADGIGGGVDLPVAESGSTEGTKKMLIIRVDFPDKPGQVVTDATLKTLITSMGTHWAEMSYGKTTWAKAGEGSAITPTVRLPRGHTNYTGFSTMLAAARAAAEDAGFDYRDYDFEVVVTGDKPDVSFGGIAYVGGRGAWLANSQWNLGVCSHEVGHNFGLNHSGFWATTDGTVTGAGANVEYGNPFDHMGGASSSTSAHYNARQKNYLDWLPDAAVRKILADGTVTQRITAMDRDDATGYRAIAVDRTGTTQDYWIEYRAQYASNLWMKDGVVVNFGEVAISNARPSLLDFTPGTAARDDCPLLIGKTFSDTAKNIHITPVRRGATPDGVPWIEVTVNRGLFTGNHKPVAALQFLPANPAVSANTGFTAVASDPDGDTLSYFWDWGDGQFTANNSSAATHQWSSAGIKTVRCTVSDMKGQAATASVLVQVGTSSTFFISGTVHTAGGLPLAGVTVSAGSLSDATDSEGFFAVTGLNAGSYSVTAAKTNYVFNVSGFTNPVSVGPSRTNTNFVVPPAGTVLGSLKPALLNAGSNTGAIPLVISDSDTPAAELTLTAVSSNPAIVPGENITFGTGDPRTVTVSAPSGVSGTVTITLSVRDPENHSSTSAWPVTVNAPPILVPSALTTPQNTPLEVDLRTLAADDRTPDDGLAFRMDQARNGTVQMLADGHTARFTPAPGYDGPASFRLVARDRSLSARTLLLYDFEPASGSDAGSGQIADLSNFGRSGTLETAGNGEYAASADVSPALAPHSTVSLNLIENASGGAAKLKRSFTAAELDWNDSDWTFGAWVQRGSTVSEDFVFHLGDGDGHGPEEELELFFAEGTNELKLQKWGASGLEAEVVHPGVPAATWHYLSITYDRTAENAGTLSLYVDGFPAGSAPVAFMAVNQAQSMVVGGHADASANLTRWLDGRLDDVMLTGEVLSRAELRQLATMGAAHVMGLSDTGTVNISVTGTNDPPALLPPPDTGLNTNQTSLPLPVRVSDAESDARTLTVTGNSSNPALIPNSGIALSAAPAAWSSTDIGTVSAAGSTVEDHGTFLISATGTGVAGTADAFRFVSQDAGGDGEWICRVVSVDYADANSRAGIMLRAGVAEDAPFAMISLTAGDGVQFHSRPAAGGVPLVTQGASNIAGPVWLRLVRSGATVTGSYAADQNGAPGAWQTAGTEPAFAQPAALKAGLAVMSGVEASPTTATVDSIAGRLKTGGERTLTLTPVPGQTGTATITLQVSDGAASSTAAFLVAVGVNTPPTITPAPDVTVKGAEVPAAFPVTLGDLHTVAAALTLTGTSSNALLLPNNRITFTGTGSSRSVQLRPVPGETGTATVTLTVSDGTLPVSITFTLTVQPGDPALLVSAGTNWRFLDTGTAPANWNTVAFNDSAWSLGPAQLGFGDGDENTLVSANATRKTTYFRRRFDLADAALYQWLELNVLRDDGAVVYLNGQEIVRTNMPEGVAITSATDAQLAVNNADESRFHPFMVRHAPFVAGANVIAVEVHQKGTTSGDLSFDLEARGRHPSPVEVIPAGSVWRYLDTGADPGNGWTNVSYVDAAWKSGPAQLGCGDGDEATVIEGGPESARYTTSWFRRRFDLTETAGIVGVGLRVLRDDGVQVWLNDLLLYRDNLPDGTDSATLALTAVNGAEENEWRTVWLPPDVLFAGANMLAAEVHQSSLTSPDVSFDLQLLLYTADALPPLAASVSGADVTVTWPLWAGAWQVQSSADMAAWTTESGVPETGANGYSLTLPRGAGRRYFRLVLP